MKTFASIACLVMATSMSVSTEQNQLPAPAAAPRFEVASVKMSGPRPSDPSSRIRSTGVRTVGDRFTAANLPLRFLVRLAYGVHDFQIEGGPSWQTSQRFDIAAKAEDGFKGGEQEMLPMLKTLLNDRFNLKVRVEMRNLPLRTLVIARDDGKLGRNLRPSTSDCSTAAAAQQKQAEAVNKGGVADIVAISGPCVMAPFDGGADGIGIRANGQPVSVLIPLLTQATGRIVLDRTGLTGLYDWEMKFDPQFLIGNVSSQAGIDLRPGVNPPKSNGPSLLTALRDELGLRLDSERGPVEVLVIDSAEMPTPN
jgi:uncharacterized protein (TIGR03435 family)